MIDWRDDEFLMLRLTMTYPQYTRRIRYEDDFVSDLLDWLMEESTQGRNT